MKFVPWSRGLYWRIVVLYMAAVVIAVAGTAVIYWWQWRRDIYMVNQRVNWNVAKELAAELEPLLVQPIDEDALTRRLAEIAYLNPAMEVFILDSGGTIVHSLVGLVDRKVFLMQAQKMENFFQVHTPGTERTDILLLLPRR